MCSSPAKEISSEGREPAKRGTRGGPRHYCRISLSLCSKAHPRMDTSLSVSREPHVHGKSAPMSGNQDSRSDAGKVQESHVKAQRTNIKTDVRLPSLPIFWGLLPCYACNSQIKGGAANQIWPISSAKSTVLPLMALHAR